MMAYNIHQLGGVPVDFSFVKGIYSTLEILGTYSRARCHKTQQIKNEITIEAPDRLIDMYSGKSLKFGTRLKDKAISIAHNILSEACKQADISDIPLRYRNNPSFIKLRDLLAQNCVDSIKLEKKDTKIYLQCTSKQCLQFILCYISTIFPNIVIYYSFTGSFKKKCRIINQNIIEDRGQSLTQYETPVSIAQLLSWMFQTTKEQEN